MITEDTPMKNPYWEYSRQKIACEERLNRAWREEDFPATIVRPSLTYDTVIPLSMGSWDDWTMIDRMRRGEPVVVHGDGQNCWTITHADDFATGLIGLMGNPLTRGHAFHITSDEVLTWDEIWHQAEEAAGCQANIVHVPSDFIASMDDFQRGSLLGDKAVSAIFYAGSPVISALPSVSSTRKFALRTPLAGNSVQPAGRVLGGWEVFRVMIQCSWPWRRNSRRGRCRMPPR